MPDGATDGVIVSRGEAKAFLNLDHDDDDALITSLILAGEQCAETYLNRDLRARSYEAVFTVDDSWAGHYHRHNVYPCPQHFATGRPAHEVTAVKMWDAANTLTTLDGAGADAVYQVRGGKGGGLIVVLDSDAVSLYARGSEEGDLAIIEFGTADATSANLPGYHAIKRAVLHMVAGGYETREDTVQGSGASYADNPAVMRLLTPYRYNLNLVGA